MHIKNESGQDECLLYDENNKDILISGSNDSKIRLWNLKNGSIIKTLTGHTRNVRCLLLYDKNTLISGSDDKTIRIWNLCNFDWT